MTLMNQCDGCRLGLPTRRSHFTDIHYGADGLAVMACTKKLYELVTHAQLVRTMREIASELERNNAPLTKADRDVITKRLWELYE